MMVIPTSSAFQDMVRFSFNPLSGEPKERFGRSRLLRRRDQGEVAARRP